MFKKLCYLLTLIALFGACTVLPESRNSAYDLTVVVRDNKGLPMQGIIITTHNNQRVSTNIDGRATLIFTRRGRHTITLEGYYRLSHRYTIQIPLIDEHIFTIYLNHTQMADHAKSRQINIAEY